MLLLGFAVGGRLRGRIEWLGLRVLGIALCAALVGRAVGRAEGLTLGLALAVEGLAVGDVV